MAVNLLTNSNMWYKFFDRVYFFGPTIETDKLYKQIAVDSDQIVTGKRDFLPKLQEWLENQKDEVKRDPTDAEKVLFFFEDITSFYNSIQQTEEFAMTFNAIRHHKATAYANVHKIKAFNRTARMACQHILCFPVNGTEVDVLYQDWGPRSLTKDQFHQLCEDAWKPDEHSDKPFLYINKYKPDDEKYRKCFTHILNLNYYRSLPPKSKQASLAKEMKVGKPSSSDSTDSHTDSSTENQPSNSVQNKRKRKKQTLGEKEVSKIWKHYQKIMRSKDSS